MKHSTTWGKRAIAVAGVAALTLPALAGTATAVDYTLPTTDGGTLTIHKYDASGVQDGGKSGTALTGTTDDAPTKATPIEGVPFTATALCADSGATAIDLKTNAGWDAIAGVTATNYSDKGLAKCTSGGDVQTGSTTADGSLALSLAKTTLYLVEEGDAAPSKQISKKAEPFLVTMPLAGTNGAWNNKVHVYPKNTTAAAPKKEIVAGDSTKIGTAASDSDQVQWQLTASLPAYPSGSTAFDKVQIVDTMGSDLALKKADTIDSITLGGAALETGDYAVSTSDQVVTIALTASGLAKAKEGDQIVVKVTTSLGSATGGSTTNTFKLVTSGNNQGTDTDNPVPSTDEPKILRGTFEIAKTDKDGGAALADAKFKVCEANTAHDACATPGTYVKDADGADAEYTTAAGTGKVQGTLLIAKTENGAQPSATSKWYCAVETEAPDNYVRDTRPTCFEVSSTDTVAKPKAVSITNAKSNSLLPGLPVTGAQGLVLLVLGGAALVAIAAGSALVIRRRQA